jgi:hypothetical protein
MTFSAECLRDKLESLRLAYEMKGQHVTRDLLPPLSSEEIRAQCRWFPIDLPEELLALYSWRNGQRRHESEAYRSFNFRDCAFLSLQEAKDEYGEMMRTYGSNPADAPLLQGCFPVAAFEQAWLVLPCREQHLDRRFKRPVISVFEGISVYFCSFESMVDTALEWVRSPNYHDGQLPGEDEMKIWKRNNPGVFER